MSNAWAIRVRGQVQGVGFRPFVWQLAREMGLAGQVLNDPEGVLIHLACADPARFVAALRDRAPPLARVDAVDLAPHVLDPVPADFSIAPSQGEGAETRITPDAATCPECCAEIAAPGRRQGYAFTNCTHCGPRYSILAGLPYDRARTSMAGFALCPACRAEYEDPGDRRFHAQPIACPECGPRLWLEGAEGATVPGDPIAQAAAMLRDGAILGVKGLGGFHLACDATAAPVLARLRARKRRPAKPLAVMAPEALLADLAELTAADRALLRDPAAPVVLVPARAGRLPAAVAPGMATLGVMLPYTPLHHLLLAAFGGPLVMTSANLSGAPQVIGNAEARAALAGIADALLVHDREILRRLDDSVERARPPAVLRRARGRVPGTLALPPGFEGCPQILGTGGQMKAAICLVKGGQAMLSQHLGDLDEARTAAEFDLARADMARLFDHRPQILAADPHPGYRATQAAEATARAHGLPLVAVQHHHAHLAACLGDALWPRDGGPVVGLILDGTGLGADGTIWGGEVLRGGYSDAERVAHLAPAPLAGGDRAAREPWRNALVRLDAAGLSDLADGLFADHPRAALRAAVAAGVNAPLSSSAGRLFDAVAACLGLCAEGQSYEGEAAMRLEALAEALPVGAADPYPIARAGAVLDPAPLFHALAADLGRGVAPGLIAARFHAGLAAALAAVARAEIAAGRAVAVALSGGVFQNTRLAAECMHGLSGLRVLRHTRVPANDGGLAFGQVLVAASRHFDAREMRPESD